MLIIITLPYMVKRNKSIHSFNNYLENTYNALDLETLVVWKIHPRIRFLPQKSFLWVLFTGK